MLGKQIGIKVNQAFDFLEELIHDKKPIISEIENIIKASHDRKDVFNVASNQLADINVAISEYNDSIVDIIYGIRGQEDGFPYEEICLELEKCRIDDTVDLFLLKGKFLGTELVAFKKNLSISSVKNMRERIYDVAGSGFNHDVQTALLAS